MEALVYLLWDVVSIKQWKMHGMSSTILKMQGINPDYLPLKKKHNFFVSATRVQNLKEDASPQVMQRQESTLLNHLWQSYFYKLKSDLSCLFITLPIFFIAIHCLPCSCFFMLDIPDEFLMAWLQNTIEVNDVYILFAKSALERITCLQIDPG